MVSRLSRVEGAGWKKSVTGNHLKSVCAVQAKINKGTTNQTGQKCSLAGPTQPRPPTLWNSHSIADLLPRDRKGKGVDENSSDQHHPPQGLGEELQLQVQPEVLSVQIPSCLLSTNTGRRTLQYIVHCLSKQNVN